MMVFGDMENAGGCLSGRKRRPGPIHRRLHWKSWKQSEGCWSVSPSRGSGTSSYLLVMTEWDRQDGANAALKSHRTAAVQILYPHRCHREVAMSLRDVPQWVLDLVPQVLNVLPLFLRQALPPHVDVLHLQLLLIKQPLHNKHRRYTGKNDTRDPIFQYRYDEQASYKFSSTVEIYSEQLSFESVAFVVRVLWFVLENEVGLYKAKPHTRGIQAPPSDMCHVIYRIKVLPGWALFKWAHPSRLYDITESNHMET